MKFNQMIACAVAALGLSLGLSVDACAASTVLPQSALVPSTTYYTENIGGGIGPVVVMTGGGSDNNAGQADGRNDDGFSGPIDLGFTLSFFGQNYTSLFINNNGSVSFKNGVDAFQATGPTGVADPIISPWFGDVDTLGSASGVVHVRSDIANEVIVTWDGVGYYANGNQDNRLNSFQLVLRGTGEAVPAGEGTIGFFYKSMDWDAQTGGAAAIGFGDGQGNSVVLAGSLTAGLDDVVENHHLWFDATLAPVPPIDAVPEPQTYALILAGLGCVAALARRRKR